MAFGTGDHLSAAGIPYPLANEILAQIANANTGNARSLSALGMPAPMAIEVAAQITAKAVVSDHSIKKLTAVGINPAAAKIIVNAI